MHLSHLRLRDFRNYARLDADFAPGFHLLLGDNAQGKTNILEAIYLLATLRSFRGVASSQMVRHGQSGYFVGANIEQRGQHQIKLYWSSKERNLTLDGRPIRKMGEYLGAVRAVVFCSEDIHLVKGPASRRRRFLDLLLTQTHPTYLALLHRYTRAVRSRNAVLKHRGDAATLDAFTNEMISLGNEIMQARRKLMPVFLPLAQAAYERITKGAEEFVLDYAPNVKNDFLLELRQSQGRERVLKSTLVGPHRDDVGLTLDGRSAAQFGSEGQKRSVVIALKIAQAEYLTRLYGQAPILLIDDIMGELDVRRRSGLLPLLKDVREAHSQVFMTCTEENWPRELGLELHRWHVRAGRLIKNDQ